MGSTGYQPVPVGDPPTGTARCSSYNRAQDRNGRPAHSAGLGMCTARSSTSNRPVGFRCSV